MIISFFIENIIVPLEHFDEDPVVIAKRILSQTHISYKDVSWHIHKKSVDARKKEAIKFVYSVVCEAEVTQIPDEKYLLQRHIKYSIHQPFHYIYGKEKIKNQITVVGFGPAGMFCSLLLAEAGLRPVVYERGGSIDDRVISVQKFLNEKKLDTDCNIQFGAGGAGTFSDGKLTTRINDSFCDYILKRFVEFGAPNDILYKAKPHIGTDYLRVVVKNIDARIRALGGRIHYRSKVEEIGDSFIRVNGEKIPSDATVLAIGHSARDMYYHLLDLSYPIVPKAFSCGVRVEHLQSDLDIAMYGNAAGKFGLDHADYSLSYRQGNRGVYSFCMCPGGVVMASSSENETIVTNGMSNYARDGINANAAINVSVLPEDYGSTPIKAIQFQEDLEKKAYLAGGKTFAAPCEFMGHFLERNQVSDTNRIHPSYMDGYVNMVSLSSIMPSFMTEMLRIGFYRFGKMIRGFDDNDVPITGFETRTSSPIRILRNNEMFVDNHPSIYPCGEGAGYAGGIMSAAVDGIRVALEIIKKIEIE